METNKVIYKVIKVTFIVLLVVLLVYGTTRMAMTAYDFGYRVFTESAIDEAPGKDVDITITTSMSEKDIAELLYEKGLVRDENLFYLQLKLSAYTGKIVPGEYVLNTSMEAKEMMVIMAQAEETAEE